MAESGEKIATSELKPKVDEYLLGGMALKKIARYLKDEHGVTFNEKTIKDYRDNFFRSKDGPLQQVIKVTENIANNELPAKTEKEVLARHFSIDSTNHDLDLIYERIRVLRENAKTYRWDDSYDKRIGMYLSQAESIRTRVFKYNYEDIRRSVLLNMGKKIVAAAISTFLPYVRSDRRKEAVSEFQDMVTPLLGIKTPMKEPDDIQEVREEVSGDDVQK